METNGKGQSAEQISKLKTIYSTAEIRDIFKKRRDDEMFLEVGKLTRRKKDKDKNDLIWRGFHVLVDSEYSEV